MNSKGWKAFTMTYNPLISHSHSFIQDSRVLSEEVEALSVE